MIIFHFYRSVEDTLTILMSEAYSFDEEDVTNLRLLGFKWIEISEIVLGEKDSQPLYRWRQRVDYQDPLENVTDEELDEIVYQFQQGGVDRGRRALAGHLLTMGIKTSYSQRRESVERVDGEGVKERLRKKRTRVRYDVTVI